METIIILENVMLGKKNTNNAKKVQMTSNKEATSPASNTPKTEINKIKPEVKDITNFVIYSPYETNEYQRVEEAMLIVHPLIMEEIDVSETSRMSSEELINYIRPLIGKILNEKKLQLNAKEQNYLEKRILDDMIGLGPLESLLADDTISDILVNGYNNVFVERHGKLEKTNIKFRNDEHVMNIISRIVSIIGRRVDESTPYVDARLNDGSRVNAIIPPLAIDGPSISIRKFRRQTITLENMVQNNNLSYPMKVLLSIATKVRMNIIIVGGTGSGKTTILNALSHEIPSDQRIITIEDSAELQLQQPHVVRLETRPPNVEGKGAITERNLVRNALRMRPDRIILGEIRGEEAFDMLQAMNTGHDGSMCTIHASSPREVPARLINMVMMSGYDFPPEAILTQIAASINLLVQVSRMRDGKRRVINITEIVGVEGKVITMQDLFTYIITGENAEGYLTGEYRYTGIKPKFMEAAANYGLEEELLRALKL